jgi:hypothetical protein
MMIYAVHVPAFSKVVITSSFRHHAAAASGDQTRKFWRIDRSTCPEQDSYNTVIARPNGLAQSLRFIAILTVDAVF